MCKDLKMGHVTISAATNEFMKSGSPDLEVVGSQILISGLNDPDIAWAVQEVINAGITDPEPFIQALFQKRTTYPDPLVEGALRFRLQQMIKSGELGNGAVVDNIMSMKHCDLTSSVLLDKTGKPFTDYFYLHASPEIIYARAEKEHKNDPNRYNTNRISNGLDFFKKTTMPMVEQLGKKVKWLDANQSKETIADEALHNLN